MWTAILAAVLSLLALLCAVFVLRHAFQRSLGAGVMVLCIPCFIVFYAIVHFEHPLKSWILAGWLATAVLAAALDAHLIGALLAVS